MVVSDASYVVLCVTTYRLLKYIRYTTNILLFTEPCKKIFLSQNTNFLFDIIIVFIHLSFSNKSLLVSKRFIINLNKKANSFVFLHLFLSDVWKKYFCNYYRRTIIWSCAYNFYNIELKANVLKYVNGHDSRARPLHHTSSATTVLSSTMPLLPRRCSSQRPDCYQQCDMWSPVLRVLQLNDWLYPLNIDLCRETLLLHWPSCYVLCCSA